MKNNQLANYYNSKATLYGASSERLRRTLDLVDDSASLRILDIGCATGYMGKILKQKGHYVVGFDLSKRAIKLSKKSLDEVYVMDIEKDKFPDLPNFDLVLVSEVIEHLFQPEKVLLLVGKHLKSNGKLIVSTPNFLYWGNRIKFLLGDFSYTKQGMFDEGHIHFFSYHSLRSLLENTGFSVVGENHVSPSFLGRIGSRLLPGVFSYQFILLAQKVK